MRLPLAATLVLGLSACASTGPGGPPAPEHVRVEVIAAVQALFDGMREKDMERLREVLSPTASIVQVDAESGESSTSTVEEFLDRVESAPYQLNEWMWDPEVRVDGPLATLWAPYGFHRDAQFSHRGYDAFHLVREDSGWRIVAITYSRRTEPIRPPLDPDSGRG